MEMSKKGEDFKKKGENELNKNGLAEAGRGTMTIAHAQPSRLRLTNSATLSSQVKESVWPAIYNIEGDDDIDTNALQRRLPSYILPAFMD